MSWTLWPWPHPGAADAIDSSSNVADLTDAKATDAGPSSQVNSPATASPTPALAITRPGETESQPGNLNPPDGSMAAPNTGSALLNAHDGPDPFTYPSTTGFSINLIYDAAALAAPASFRAGIQKAADLLAATLTDKITINVKIDYSGTGGGAAAGPDSGLFESYSAIRSDLINNATPGDTAFNALPSGSSIQGQSQVAVWNAQLKLFGLLSANDTTTDDGGATFATDIDPNLLVGVALHELTHAMGRIPYGPQPDIFDLFRFTSAGTRLFQGGATAPAAYFSLDGGNTKLADYGQTSDASDFLNSGVQGPTDPFNEFYNSSTLQQLTAVDLKQLDALGYHLSQSQPPANLHIVDIIPTSDSAESGQNSEPSLAVNPLNPTQMIAGAFSSNFISGGVASPYFKTTNGGTTWSDYGNLTTQDKTIAWKQDGSAALTSTLLNNQIGTYSGTIAGSSFGSPINTFNPGHDLDQPWIRTGPSNHVYAAYNDLSAASGKTASVLVSTNGGSTYSPVTVDRVGGAAGQDAPSVRLAVDGNTVYSAFTRWNSVIENDSNGLRFGSQVVIVRSDNGGADGFTALGTGGNGVQIATPTSAFASSTNTPLTLGQERTGGDVAIAVDPNNAQHVVVAYGNAPGANGSGQLQLVVAESTNGGASWATKFTTSSSTRSAEPALSILSNGAIGLLYDNYDPASNKLSQHLLTTTNDFVTTADTTLASESNATPSSQFSPYLGDFFDLTSVGNTFYGIFSASNADNGTDAQFSNVTFQRNFTGTPGTSSFHLTDANGNSVSSSIDPFFFSYQISTGDTTAPVFVNDNPLAVGIGATATISPSLLAVSDPDNTDAQLTYTVVTAPSHGTLLKNSSPTSSFTQADIDNGLIAYHEDGSRAASDSFIFNVSDPAGNKTANTPFQFQIGSMPRNDFNGDGASDLLFQNINGTPQIWLMNGTTIISETALPQPPASWKVIGSGDFNGDGKADIIWQNSDGTPAIWEMNGTSIISAVALIAPPSSWHIIATGDFNGDGKADILWQNSTGQPAIWEMNGTSIISAVGLATPPVSWRVIGAGDFDGDGKADILWQNSDATPAIWEMNGTSVVSAVALTAPSPQSKIVGTGDFNGDGHSDILWVNTVTNTPTIWEMNGTSIISTAALPAPPSSWKLIGTSDVNGDGHADILWQNSDGTPAIWEMNGTTIISSVALPSPGAAWQIKNDGPIPADQMDGASVSPHMSAPDLVAGTVAFASAGNPSGVVQPGAFDVSASPSTRRFDSWALSNQHPVLSIG